MRTIVKYLIAALLGGCAVENTLSKESVARMQPISPMVAKLYDGRVFTGHGSRGLTPGSSTYAFYHGADDAAQLNQKAGYWMAFHVIDGEFELFFRFVPRQTAFDAPLGSPELRKMYPDHQTIKSPDVGLVGDKIAFKVPTPGAGPGTYAFYVLGFDQASRTLSGQGVGGVGLHWDVDTREVSPR